MSNVIALEHLNGTIVSILVSKTTNKYRLQSDSLPALALLVVELQLRLQFHFSGSTNLQVGLDSPLPTQELWRQVETHFITYTELKEETVLTKHLEIKFSLCTTELSFRLSLMMQPVNSR